MLKADIRGETQWPRQRHEAALMNWRLHSSVARANGRTFAQEVEELLKKKAPFSPEERVAVSRYFHSQCKGIQPSLTLDEIREGLM